MKRLAARFYVASSIAAYTAGLVDGEGSIQINSVRPGSGRLHRYWTLIVQVSNSSLPLLRKLRSEWGNIGSLTVWLPRGSKKNRVSVNWRMCSTTAESFLQAVLPFLRLKRPQAAIALRFRNFTGTTRGSLTAVMIRQRTALAIQMRALNARTGKGSAVLAPVAR